MGQIQNALLGAAGAVASAGLTVKKVVGQKTNSPSAVAAQKARASLSEHREAKKQKGLFNPNKKEKIKEREMKDFL